MLLLAAPQEDEAFSTKLMTGINAGMSEQWVRSMLFDYTSSLFELAVNAIEIPDKVSDRVQANGWRLEGLRTTHLVALLCAQDPWRHLNQRDGILGGSNLRYYLSWLRSEVVMDGEEVLAIFQAITTRNSYDVNLVPGRRINVTAKTQRAQKGKTRVTKNFALFTPLR